MLAVILSTRLKFGDELDVLFNFGSPIDKCRCERNGDSVGYSTIQREKSVFPEVDRPEVACSLSIQWFMFLVVFSGLSVELYHGYQYLLKKSPLFSF